MNLYIENGFRDREDYLYNLSLDYGVDFSAVKAIADLYGPDEDFDGLITYLEDSIEF